MLRLGKLRAGRVPVVELGIGGRGGMSGIGGKGCDKLGGISPARGGKLGGRGMEGSLKFEERGDDRV